MRSNRPPGWTRLFDLAARMLAYRKGDLAGARECLQRDPTPILERKAIADILLAMVEFRAGNRQLAHELYETTVDTMETEWREGDQTRRRMEIDHWLTFDILRREAAQLLQIDEPAPETQPESHTCGGEATTE